MCGRYSPLTEEEIIAVRAIIQEWSLRFVRDDFENYEPPGEIQPTNKAPVIVKNKEGVSFESLRFGFKKWDGKGVIINARSETIKSKSMFSKLADVGRCAVPAHEYYEWKAAEDGEKNKKKHFIKDPGGNILFFAGLYREAECGKEFVIITKDSFGEVTDIHDRMPVILRVDQLEAWLSGALTLDDITHMDFNASVFPCKEEHPKPGDAEQLSLF